MCHSQFLYSTENSEEPLYDLLNDPGESNNLAATESARIPALEQAATHRWQDIARGVYDTNCPPDIMQAVRGASVIH